MAEGFLPEEEAEEEEAEIQSATDGFATSLAYDIARGPGHAEEEARAFLRDQRKMLNVQLEHLHEQRAILISRLKANRMGAWFKVCFQMFTALTATCIGGLLLTMLVDAFNSKSVIVEPFNSPAALAANGLTGKVLAGDLLDGLTRLQAATRAAASKRHLANAWSGDIKVEVPETGVSIGEIDRLLHERFGHDEHIQGDLRLVDGGGVAMNVRGDGVLPKTFTGPVKDLDKLVTQAAEYVYGQSEPVLFAQYLTQSGRDEDAQAFIQDAYAHAEGEDKAALANQWGEAALDLGHYDEAAAKFRLAINLKPKAWGFWDDLVYAEQQSGHEEAAWRAGTAMLAQAKKASKNDRPKRTDLANFEQLTQDWPTTLTDTLEDAKLNAGAGTDRTPDGPVLADIYARMHDWRNAELNLTASDPDEIAAKGEAFLIPARRAIDDGNPAAAVAPMEAFYKAWLADVAWQSTFIDNSCLLGLAYGLTGRIADAEPVYKRLGQRLACYAYRADGLEHAGDHAAADEAYAAAIALAPDLPIGWYHRGMALARRGDLKGAASDLAAAHARGPHWADPLKAWGDVLARQGQWRDALQKYDEAIKYAPNWAMLSAARSAAAHRSTQFAIAPAAQ